VGRNFGKQNWRCGDNLKNLIGS